MRNFLIFLAFAAACSSTNGALAEGRQPLNPDKPEADWRYATSLKCPKENHGILDYTLGAPNGAKATISINYIGHEPVKIRMYVTAKGQDTFTTLDVRVDGEMDDKARDRMKRIRSHADELFSRICLGNAAAQAKYQEMLGANRKFLNEAR